MSNNKEEKNNLKKKNEISVLEKINEKIVQILKNNNILKLTEIQEKTFSCASNGHDIIGVSQTGTGKTLAFILPMIEQILKSKKTYHCLIITPTRELANQIADCVALFRDLEIKSALLVGGEKIGPQIGALNERPHIIIGTPGRIVLHIEKNKNFRINLIKKLIFDEADRFFSKDFVTEIELIANKMKGKTQTLMFSATMDDKTQIISKLFMRDPKIFEVSKKYEVVKKMEEFYSFVPEKYKETVLVNLIKQNENLRSIIFVGMCSTAKKIEILLNSFGINCLSIYGNLPQAKREELMQKFRDSEFNCLISTDVVSRGLDIPDVDFVVNYDLPSSAKDYIHRTGRTARAEKDGKAYSIITQYDIEQFQKLEFVMKKNITNELEGNFDQHENVVKAWEKACSEINESTGFKRRN